MLTRSTMLTLVGMSAALSAAAARAADYYVAPYGSDTGAGTRAAPFQTIQKAIDTATQPGDTVMILEGIYREELVVKAEGTLQKPIVIKADRKQAAIVDGSMRVQDWSLIDKQRNLWSVGLKGKKAPYNDNKGRWDMPPRSEQVFVDDKHCTHVKEDTAPDDMPEYSYTATLADPAYYTLRLPAGVDPNIARTDITVLSRLLDVQQSCRHVVIDGICFRRAMNTYQQKMVHIGGENNEVSNCVFEYSSAGWGVDLACRNSHIHDSIIRFNGCLGFAYHGTGNLFENNLVTGNDLAGYGEWEAGGTKIVGNGNIIRHNRFIDNLGGVAIWLDCGPCNNVIEYNYVSGNRGEGIRAETSNHNYIGYNIVENTQPCTRTAFGKTSTSPGIGISVQNSAETVVCNNFLKDNCGTDIQLFNYHRPGTDLPKFQINYPDEKQKQWLQRSWDAGFVYTNDNIIVNNIVVHTKPEITHPGIWFRGGFDGKNPQSYGNQIDHNFYWNSVTHAPKLQIGNTQETPDGGGELQKKYGFEMHALGGFSANDYEKTPFTAEYPYAPTAEFAGIGKGKLLGDFAGHTNVDYLGNPVTLGSMGPIQYKPKP